MSTQNVEQLFAPLRKTLHLKASPTQTFARFAERFGDWWPRHNGHSVFGGESAGCRLEGEAGGRIVEFASDGREAEWGRIEVWDPPCRLQFSWYPGRDAATAQTVEVTFTPEETGTLISLEHRDWHVLGAQAEITRTDYDRGWDHVLGSFGAHASRGAARSVYSATPRGRVAAFTTQVNAPIERVFELLATAEGLNRWFTDHTSLDPRAGGLLVFRWRGEGAEVDALEFFGRVHTHRAPDCFAFDWQADSGAYDLRCRIDFEAAGGGTRISLTETGFRDDATGLQDLLNRQSGWSQSLTQLKAFAEHGIRI